MLPAFLNNTDAYRAFLKDDDYVWGSNQVKARTGSIYFNMNYYNLDAANSQNYDDAALGYLHYLHGVNPVGKVMLSNMGSYDAEESCEQIYHNWFGDGTPFDNNPPSGFVTGGANPDFVPASGTISPPQGQPVQKSYLDWNTAWPENSWEVTEPAIYYQAAYVQLLSAYAGASNVILPVEFEDFFARPKEDKYVDLIWMAATVENVDFIEIQRGKNTYSFETIGTTKEISIGRNTFQDRSPFVGLNYYRLKINDLDGTVSYSKTINIQLAKPYTINIFPNPATDELSVVVQGNQILKDLNLTLTNMTGQIVFEQEFTGFSNQMNEKLAVDYLPRGVYYLKMGSEGEQFVKKVVLK